MAFKLLELPTRLVGKEFGGLVVTRFLRREGGLLWWECICVCGTVVEATASQLRSKRVVSCGCFSKPRLTKSSLRVIWTGMLNRCRNTGSKGYKHYGGRGIEVCDRWLNFDNFKADMGESKGLTLDRVNNELGYFKENCEWRSYKSQTRNRRNTVMLTYEGETKPLALWAELKGIPYSVLLNRKRRLNYSDHDCITKPIRK